MARFLGWLFGPRCRYGCGTRVFVRDVAAHEHHDHAGDCADCDGTGYVFDEPCGCRHGWRP